MQIPENWERLTHLRKLEWEEWIESKPKALTRKRRTMTILSSSSWCWNWRVKNVRHFNRRNLGMTEVNVRGLCCDSHQPSLVFSRPCFLTPGFVYVHRENVTAVMLLRKILYSERWKKLVGGTPKWDNWSGCSLDIAIICLMKNERSRMTKLLKWLFTRW